MPQTRYDSYDSGADYEQNPEIIVSTYATVETDIGRVFGASSQYGQSLGVNFADVELIDGCLYADVDKQKFKLFSWRSANDMSPAELHERGEDPSADDASDLIRKTYAGNEKEYELVAARVEEVTDDDGNVLVEASSKVRDVEFTGDDAEFGDWEDYGGDPVDIGSFVSWFGASDNGVSVTSRSLAETLTEYGENAIVDEDDPHNWLTDTSGDDILRDDLEGRRVEFFVVTRDGDQYTYNLPILIDTSTGERVQPNNRSGGDSGNSSSPSDNDAVQEAEAADEGDYPEPIADFLGSAQGLNLTEERAEKLLTDLIESDDNAMTAEMVDDYGGMDTLIAKVI